jgi:hypothetical protein
MLPVATSNENTFAFWFITRSVNCVSDEVGVLSVADCSGPSPNERCSTARAAWIPEDSWFQPALSQPQETRAVPFPYIVVSHLLLNKAFERLKAPSPKHNAINDG